MNGASCPLCERQVSRLSKHHLLPRARGGTQVHVLPICFDCHDALHEFFDNRALAETYNNVDALLAEPRFQRHILWLQKQDPERRFAAKRPRERRRR